ncbi:MAG: sigma-70 family RNA polymerase sigma factor [Deltaproteobacteria bacterium]|nr:sigma-70 family RNA polymerase sigma factor [Kofleriaceae bacterium]
MQPSQPPAPTQADRGFVYAVARRIVRDDDEAQDIAQDALLLAHLRRGQFRGDASYRTWLYRIAASCALTSLRRRRSSRRTLDAFIAHTAAAPGRSEPADELLHRRRVSERLAGAIAELDPRYRSVLELRVHEERSEQEIADALDLSVSAVKVRAFRARNRLRASLPSAA